MDFEQVMRQKSDSQQSATPNQSRENLSGNAILQLQQRAGNRVVNALLAQRGRELEASVPKTGGDPLPPPTRRAMEAHFGDDLGSVRVHDDNAANASAKAWGADAYTAGEHVVFGRKQYVPDTPSGRKLLTHELTHVMQQRAGTAAGRPLVGTGLRVSEPGDPGERAAHEVATGRRDAHMPAASRRGTSGLVIQGRWTQQESKQIEQSLGHLTSYDPSLTFADLRDLILSSAVRAAFPEDSWKVKSGSIELERAARGEGPQEATLAIKLMCKRAKAKGKGKLREGISEAGGMAADFLSDLGDPGEGGIDPVSGPIKLGANVATLGYGKVVKSQFRKQARKSARESENPDNELLALGKDYKEFRVRVTGWRLTFNGGKDYYWLGTLKYAILGGGLEQALKGKSIQLGGFNPRGQIELTNFGNGFSAAIVNPQPPDPENFVTWIYQLNNKKVFRIGPPRQDRGAGPSSSR